MEKFNVRVLIGTKELDFIHKLQDEYAEAGRNFTESQIIEELFYMGLHLEMNSRREA